MVASTMSVTTVLLVLLLICACSVVAAQVSLELRQQFVRLHTLCNWNAQQIYESFVTGQEPASLSSIHRVIRSFKRYGEVRMRKDFSEARAASMTRHLTELVKIVLEQPDRFLDEIQVLLRDRTGVMYTRSMVEGRLLQRGYGWKVLGRIAAQRDAEERLAYRAMIRTFDPRCLLFLDESHHDRNNTRRRRGRARSGETPTVHEALGSADVRFSLLAAMNSAGFVVPACRIIEKRGVDREDFLTWVREDLCGLDAAGEPIGGRDRNGQRLVPSLLQPYDPDHPRPNSVLVLDNASIHHSSEFLELVQSTGALVRYLSPYSPGTRNGTSRPPPPARAAATTAAHHHRHRLPQSLKRR